MLADPARVKELFVAAVELPDPAARSAFLDAECGPDNDLRQRVERLLSAHDGDPGDVTPAHAPPSVTSDHSPAPDEGTVIGGKYKLLQPIGEGGMGTVWMAEQLHPVRRKVAVKLVKEGMDSRRVLARFEAERQALALMDHPHIAKVLDAGATDFGPGARAPGYAPSPLRGSEVPSPGGATARSQGREPLVPPPGRPYFVMELVKGVPLTRYCDDHRLTVPQRLELFQQICSAVQHAHQKGIIHRDLKPGNVLVENHDGRPVPKVIDFGLAKAVSELPLTDKSLFTAFGAVMGTPQYMAPEQASFSAVDVDTRADVYALGVILYELLTGSPPIGTDRLRAAALDEVLRVIREEEPPTPSQRLSTSEGVPSVAANRQTEPKKLGRLVRGELDWIVMKALAKDRGRRYETATGFGADVGRYLAGEPVLAVPPSAGYRLRTFVRRNRAAVTATAVVLVAVLTGAVAATWQAVRATAAERAARESATRADGERVKADAARQVAEKAAESERAANLRGHDAVKELAAIVWHRNLNQTLVVIAPDGNPVFTSRTDLVQRLPESERPLFTALLGYYEAFTSQLGHTREALEAQAESFSEIAAIRNTFGDHPAAVSAGRSALAIWEQVVGPKPTEPKDRESLRSAQMALAEFLHQAGQHEEALTQWAKATALSPADDYEFLRQKAKGLARAGLTDEALAANDALPRDDFDSACVLALASVGCNAPDRRNLLAAKAVSELRRVALNRPDAGMLMLLKTEPDLSGIHDRPDFRALVAEVEAKQPRPVKRAAQAPPPREVVR